MNLLLAQIWAAYSRHASATRDRATERRSVAEKETFLADTRLVLQEAGIVSDDPLAVSVSLRAQAPHRAAALQADVRHAFQSDIPVTITIEGREYDLRVVGGLFPKTED